MIVGIKKEKIRKIFTDNLPRKEKLFDWFKSIGYKVRFIYDDIEGEVDIIGYDGKFLSITYNNKILEISTGNLQKCRLGKLLNKCTDEFKIEISTQFIDDKRNITIINKENRKDRQGRNFKWYQYKCNKCGFCDDRSWIEESSLLNGQGCSCCHGKTAVLGINTIWDTDRIMCNLGVSEEDAKTHTKWSNVKVDVICPDCGRIKNVSLDKIHRFHSIGCVCSDTISYPEKLMFNILEQLNVENTYQLTKKTLMWCNKYKYDFYFKINNKEYIIETHGSQHYKNKFTIKKIRSLENEIENDKNKKALALANGIKEEDYIVIDCRYSELEFIRNNIVDSKLNEIFDLLNIDWNKAEEYALKNLCKKACEMKRDNPNILTVDICKFFKLSKTTIIRYLKKGSKIWEWCNYDPKEEQRKSGLRVSSLISKKVEVFNKMGESLGIFPSCAELERQSEKILGVKLINQNISKVCIHHAHTHKGLIFKYV